MEGETTHTPDSCLSGVSSACGDGSEIKSSEIKSYHSSESSKHEHSRESSQHPSASSKPPKQPEESQQPNQSTFSTSSEPPLPSAISRSDKGDSCQPTMRPKQFGGSHPAVKKQHCKSYWWDQESDPFQVFEVEHETCLDLEITIKKGESITKGSTLQDFMDTPDPYVVLKIPGSSNPSKRTSHVDNCTNPIWDESFHFFLDPSKEHTLCVILMDANYTVDETLGEERVEVKELTLGVPQAKVFQFANGSKIHTTLLLSNNVSPDLRFSLALCKEEKDFLRSRRLKVLEAMKKLLGDKAPQSDKQVPVIAVMGSGGGFRAMTSLSGAIKALQETGILDCATYISGLSGSSWYISTLYAHDEFPNVTHSQVQTELRESVTTDWKWKLLNSATYVASVMAKYRKGQPISMTDFFGHLLGDVLLKARKHKKLTDTQPIMKQGTVPMPLYTCLNAMKNVSPGSFSEWVEFSPFEVGIAKYGTFMKTQDFGCKFIVGKKIKHFDEYPLHFLQGVWATAFTMLAEKLVKGGKKDVVEIRKDEQTEEHLQGDNSTKETYGSVESSDSEDEKYIEGRDDKTSEEEEVEGLESRPATQPPTTDGECGQDKWGNRRKTLRQSRAEKKAGLWDSFKQSIISSTNILSNTTGITGEVLNPFRGLSLRHSFPLSPFATDVKGEDEDQEDRVDLEMNFENSGRYKSLDTKAKKLFIVDAGLAFNTPYPLLLRPQRAVDMYLSFDFSKRSTDSKQPFEELILAEKWAKQNKVPFPPIQKEVEKYEGQEIKECYIFKHPTDQFCPVILHFPLVNNKFREFKAPGVPRKTEEEKKFADFPIFDDPMESFATMNFVYEAIQFDRLTTLMEFNTLLCVEIIKREIEKIVEQKKIITQEVKISGGGGLPPL